MCDTLYQEADAHRRPSPRPVFLASRDDLMKVARFLGELRNDVVFVGGCAVVFLVPDSVVSTIRPTEDVDCILHVASRAKYYLEVMERLRALGFSECIEPGAPICRWKIEGISVDVMPTDEGVLGFSNRCYDLALQDHVVLEPLPHLQIRVIGHAVFLATKFEAFANRGQGEYEGKYGYRGYFFRGGLLSRYS